MIIQILPFDSRMLYLSKFDSSLVGSTDLSKSSFFSDFGVIYQILALSQYSQYSLGSKF